MSKFNSFYAQIACSSCGKSSELELQAHIGHLRWANFDLGDRVYDLPWTTPKKAYGPSAETDFSKPFWAIGLARCPSCNAELRFRVHIRDGRFVGVTVAEPTDSDDTWGVEPESEEQLR